MTQNSQIFQALKTEISIGNQNYETKSIPCHFSMAIYVPSLDRDGNSYMHILWTKYFKSLFKLLFTRCETSKVEGSDCNINGVIIEEVTSVISSELFDIKNKYNPSQIASIVIDHMALFTVCANQNVVKYKINHMSYLLETSQKKQ